MQQAGLTDAEIDAELAACNAERLERTAVGGVRIACAREAAASAALR